MQTTTELVTIKPIQDSTKPPLTKKQVIEATALALFQENEKKCMEIQKKREVIIKKRDKFLRQHALKSKKLIQFMCVDDWKGNWINLRVPYDPTIVKSFSDELNRIPMPPYKSIKDYQLELTEASTQKSIEVQTLVKDPVLRAKFISFGESLIGKQAN